MNLFICAMFFWILSSVSIVSPTKIKVISHFSLNLTYILLSFSRIDLPISSIWKLQYESNNLVSIEVLYIQSINNDIDTKDVTRNIIIYI